MDSNDTLGTLVIGATGFLGTALKNQLNETSNLYTSIRHSVDFIKSSSKALLPINDLMKFRSLRVFNCSSGRFQDFSNALESNRGYPLRILKKLIDLRLPISWIQFDSYAQYSSDNVHDWNYIKTKGDFNQDLEKVSNAIENFNYVQISLPHLFGENDNPERFIPRLMSNIRDGLNFTIQSPFEIFPLLDVQDCAKEVINADLSKTREQSMNHIFAIEPTEQVEVFDFFASFKEFCYSSSQLSKGETQKSISIEKWRIEEQPRLLPSIIKRRSRIESFYAIQNQSSDVS